MKYMKWKLNIRCVFFYIRLSIRPSAHMIRRFARVNSVPLYRVEHNDDSGKMEVLPITPTPANTAESIPSAIIHPHLEYQYLNLIYDILNESHEHNSRNGRTFSIFGADAIVGAVSWASLLIAH